ncbi:hypothetical protein E2C01_045485 [Portunus trituberculatus]|uniref:Uncharacterized protein n=1 Tax=Portunus trituberculatus TaxID=210409 RepID=A0A5B7G571_PORTR|nr:hypothetical protein [Portunus trituberculatus]
MMDDYHDKRFIRALRVAPAERNQEEPTNKWPVCLVVWQLWRQPRQSLTAHQTRLVTVGAESIVAATRALNTCGRCSKLLRRHAAACEPYCCAAILTVLETSSSWRC